VAGAQNKGPAQGPIVNQPTSDATDASLNTGEGMADLRRRAEAQLVGRLCGRLDKIEAADLEWLVHELGVHQVELEAQNEQLLQVQAALEASRDRYVALYEEAPVGYVTTGLDGVIVEANHLGAQMMGLSLPNLLGRRLVDHFAGVDRLRYRKACQQLLLDTANESGFLAEPKSFPSGDELPVIDRGVCLLKLSAGAQAQARQESFRKRPFDFPHGAPQAAPEKKE